ncbi:MAG: RNA methyltransferase [Flavobacteriaceae bacterium]|nr:RNA methyltransferase [Flavobacteriaceae bacterium]
MDSQLLAYLQSFLTERRRELFNEVLEERTRHITVVTEDVYQLHNTSAVMRSCDVFGIQDLHVIEARLGKKVDREIAMGAQKWVDIHRHKDVSNCISTLKSKGYRIIATTPHGMATALEEFDISQPVALFFGAEKEGVSEEVIEAADENLKIPMYGFTESLNISVSAAIILQNLVGRMRKKEIQWQLSEEEKRELQIKWTLKTIKRVDEIIERYKNEKIS